MSQKVQEWVPLRKLYSFTIQYCMAFMGVSLKFLGTGLEQMKMTKRPFPNSTLYKFKNCRVIRDHDIIREDVWVRDGKVLDPRDIFWGERLTADVDIDCHNLIFSPGFIDLQINGMCLKIYLYIINGMLHQRFYRNSFTNC